MPLFLQRMVIEGCPTTIPPLMPSHDEEVHSDSDLIREVENYSEGVKWMLLRPPSAISPLLRFFPVLAHLWMQALRLAMQGL